VKNNISLSKALFLGAVFLVAIAVPVTVYLVQQQQDTRTRASVDPEFQVIVNINDEDITKADIRKVAEENYDPTLVDNTALSDALEIIKERKILDGFADENNVVVKTFEIENKTINDDLSEINAYYDVLKDKIIESKVKSRKYNSLGCWSATDKCRQSLTDEEVATADKELAVGIPALSEIETRLKNGDAPLVIGLSVIDQNPDLIPVLAVNGYILSKIQSEHEELAKIPIFDEFGDSGLDPEILEKLYSSRVGDVFFIIKSIYK